MKVTSAKRAEHRKAILEAAAQLVRERGPDGVSVAEIMAAAGLTHGGFYGHFRSKDGLLAAAIDAAMGAKIRELEAVGRDEGLVRYAEGYLSQSHLDDTGTGCVIAALGADVPRLPIDVVISFRDGLRRYLDAAGTAGGFGRADAIRTVAGLVGAMVMARAVAAADPDLAETILDAARPSARGRAR